MFKKSQIEKVLRDIENNIPYHRIAIKIIEEIRQNEQKQTSINDSNKKKA
jgi:hypothetical protein